MHQDDFEDFDTEDMDRPVLYIEKIELVQRADKNETSMHVYYSDGSEEAHKSVDNVAIMAAQQWMISKTPLHRFATGTLMEADLSRKDHITAMFDFFKEVWKERVYSANKYAGGDLSRLDQVDDERNGAADFVTYITHYASTWWTSFPPHGRESLTRFKIAMVKVANLAFAGHRWANGRIAAMEIEAQARAGAASRAEREG